MMSDKDAARDSRTPETLYIRTDSKISKEDVDNFDYFQAYDWLETHNVDPGNLQDLTELKRLIKSHISTEAVNTVEAVQSPTLTSKGGQALMKEILNKDKLMKQELSEVYQALLNFFSLDILTEDLKTILNKLYKDYTATLKKYHSELVNDECPIVVAGETSAGKSSLLNLLLGTDVLPHSLLCATATICRLHNSQDKRVEIEDANGKVKKITIDEEDATSNLLHAKLKPYISSKEMREDHLYKLVDIYWPLPVLQDRVSIVDTPGIGEGDEMTKRLMNYLPNAVAFIYVINSSNSGGLQDDRLLHILNEQRRWEKEDKLATFNTSCAIFVCNWWDQVIAQKEEEKVWRFTLETLGKFDVKEEQIFKMSTTEAARFHKQGIGTTKMFQNLLDGIENMVPASLEAKVRRHYQFLGKFLEKLRQAIASRINNARATEEEKKKLNEEITQRLLKLRMEADKVREKLVELAKARCEKLVEDLHDHLHQEAVQTRLCSWTEAELMDIGGGDMEVTRFNADKKISKRIQDELFKWEVNKHIIKHLSDELTIKFLEEFRFLGQECSKIDMMIEGNQEWNFKAEGAKDEEKDGTIFTGGEKVILAVAAPLWLPLVAAAAVLFLPVGIGMVIREALKDKSEREKFMRNKKAHMQKWTMEHFDTVLTKESLHQFVFKAYYSRFEEKIDEVCKNQIPILISADQRMVNNIANDQRTSKEIYNQFLPIQNQLKHVLCKHQLFGLLYDSKDHIASKDIRKIKNIGQGNFSDVYLVKLQQNGREIDAAMKVLRRTLEGAEDMYAQLSELDNLRKLKHKNIVEFHGVSYSDTINSVTGDKAQYRTSKDVTHASLKFLFEFCDDTLQNIVFRTEKLQCKTYKAVEDRRKAFKFYVTMATGICDGLAFIHERRYVHRDLKLSNVLVKGNVPKICDLGFSRPELFMTGTFVGTISHMAPEVIEQKPYDSSADIYSLGILLWEFWYGRHAYVEDTYKQYSLPNLFELIKSGHRPLMHYRFGPITELQELLTQCWDQNAKKRPSANKVKDTLCQMFQDLHSQPHTDVETVYSRLSQ